MKGRRKSSQAERGSALRVGEQAVGCFTSDTTDGPRYAMTEEVWRRSPPNFFPKDQPINPLFSKLGDSFSLSMQDRVRQEGVSHASGPS